MVHYSLSNKSMLFQRLIITLIPMSGLALSLTSSSSFLISAQVSVRKKNRKINQEHVHILLYIEGWNFGINIVIIVYTQLHKATNKSQSQNFPTIYKQYHITGNGDAEICDFNFRDKSKKHKLCKNILPQE